VLLHVATLLVALLASRFAPALPAGFAADRGAELQLAADEAGDGSLVAPQRAEPRVAPRGSTDRVSTGAALPARPPALPRLAPPAPAEAPLEPACSSPAQLRVARRHVPRMESGDPPRA
jgi:hypothetical protein